MNTIPTKCLPPLVPQELVRDFPPMFLWGTATSSFQFERTIEADSRGSYIWGACATIPGHVFEGYTGQIAADHSYPVLEDVKLMKSLGLQAYRFSIAWPRVLLDERGEVNETGLDVYDRLVDTLLEHDIKPFVTLSHGDLPSSLERVGGWLNRQTAFAFANYAEVVACRLGDRVKHWITLNEPWRCAYLGYGVGCCASDRVDLQATIDAAHHLLLAHGLAAPRIRQHLPAGAQVGTAHLLVHVHGVDERLETPREVQLAYDFFNGWFLDPIYTGAYPTNFFTNMGLNPPPIEPGDLTTIEAPLDFLSVNTSFRVLVGKDAVQHLTDPVQEVLSIPNANFTAMACEISPDDLRDVLVDVSRRYPVRNLYITKSGAAFPENWDDHNILNDPQRVYSLKASIGACGEALLLGVPLRGYFVWSLIDNGRFCQTSWPRLSR